MSKLAIAAASIAVFGSLALGLWQAAQPSDGLQNAESRPLLERPEVRALACPSSGAMRWTGRQWVMTIGPATIYFPFPVVGPSKEVFAVAGRLRSGEQPAGALFQKLPLNIDAPVGTSFSVHGHNQATGAAMFWDGPTRLSENVPVSERTFVPGQMMFPGPGCYQVCVDVEGVSWGPFGFVVRSGNPGEIIAMR